MMLAAVLLVTSLARDMVEDKDLGDPNKRLHGRGKAGEKVCMRVMILALLPSTAFKCSHTLRHLVEGIHHALL